MFLGRFVKTAIFLVNLGQLIRYKYVFPLTGVVYGTMVEQAFHIKINYKMAKPPKNHGKAWTDAAVKQLEKLADGNTPTRIIALKLERTEDSVRAKASEEGTSLKPTNQSPYGTNSKRVASGLTG